MSTPTIEPSPSLPAEDEAPRRSPVNWRSVLLGLIGVIAICTLTPYNDHVLMNTRMVGNYLPVGLLLYFLFLVLVVNAPLRKLMPRKALHSGELAVAMGMVLVGCALPSAGLMNYLPASIVGMHQKAATNLDHLNLLDRVQLPDWLLPDFEYQKIRERANEDVIKDYWVRGTPEDDSFRSRMNVVPWKKWVRPALMWGLLLIPMYGAVLFLSVILRRQWVENERLPFPIATIFLQIVETPSPGRAFNRLFSSRGFWIATLAVLAAQSVNQLHEIFPKNVPLLPLKYNLYDLVNDPPFKYADYDLKRQTISFLFIGMAYFLQSKVAFSMWAFYLMFQVAQIVLGYYQTEVQVGAKYDQTFGAMLVFIITMLWVGRRHWAIVMRHMIGRARENDPDGTYLPYQLAGWGFVLCLGGMVAWLLAAGMSAVGAVLLVVMLMLLFVTVARVVAETGLVYAQIHVPLQRPWIYAMDLTSGLRTTPKSFFFTSWFSQMFAHDTRESLPVYSTHALRVADVAAYERETKWRRAAPFILVLVLALAVGYMSAGASTLFVEYNHYTTIQKVPTSPINDWGVDASTLRHTMTPSVDYIIRNRLPAESHSRIGHFTFAAALTAVLSFLRLTFTWWPLHPMGYLLAYSDSIARIWFSIFLGWMAKVILLRLGGSNLFRAAMPVFIGLVVGEAASAGVWLVINMIRASMGAI